MVSGSCFFVHAFCLGFVLKASLCVVVVVVVFEFFLLLFSFLVQAVSNVNITLLRCFA